MAASSKTAATILTYPYQVAKSRLQDHRSPVPYAGVRDCVRKILAMEGWAGFYRGLVPNIVRVLPGTMITFAVYEGLAGAMRRRAAAISTDNNNAAAAWLDEDEDSL